MLARPFVRPASLRIVRFLAVGRDLVPHGAHRALERRTAAEVDAFFGIGVEPEKAAELRSDGARSEDARPPKKERKEKEKGVNPRACV